MTLEKNQLRYEVKNSDILPEYTEERAKMKVLREEDKLGDQKTETQSANDDLKMKCK